ncbi:hypothetical protein ACWEWX_26475 [Streptomyces asiaticus]
MEEDQAVQQTAEQWSLRAGRPPGFPSPPRRQHARRLGLGQHTGVEVDELGATGLVAQRVPIAAETVGGDIGVEADEAGLGVQRHVQQRDIAVAEDRFRVGPDRVQIDQIEIADGRLSTGPRAR